MNDLRAEALGALHDGDLVRSITLASAAIRATPSVDALRWLLAELHLIAGDLERADKVLQTLHSPSSAPAVQEFRSLLRAESARRNVLLDGAVPGFQGGVPTAAQRAALQGLVLARSGDMPSAARAAAEAEALRPAIRGTAAGEVFDDIRDIDDILGPQLEVLTAGGEYRWVAWEQLARLVPEPPQRPRDLCWCPSSILLKDGSEGHVFLPCLYVSDADDDRLRLGRETLWSQGPAPVRGIGQRLLLVGERALTLQELGQVDFA
jgi:type VI secretion system protein ImpE